MENLIIEFVKQINPVQTITLVLITFYFYNRLDEKIKETNSKLDRMQSDFNNRFDKMNDLIIDLYKTLFKRDVA